MLWKFACGNSHSLECEETNKIPEISITVVKRITSPTHYVENKKSGCFLVIYTIQNTIFISLRLAEIQIQISSSEEKLEETTFHCEENVFSPTGNKHGEMKLSYTSWLEIEFSSGLVLESPFRMQDKVLS